MSANLILWGCTLPVLLIMYGGMKGLAKPKENIIIGVTIPWTRMYDPEVPRIQECYKKDLGRKTIFLAVAAVPGILIPDFAVMYLAFTIWILAVVIVPSLVYIRWNRELMRWKKEQQWAVDADVSPVELKGAAADTGVLIRKELILAVVFGCLPLLYEVLNFEAKVTVPRLVTQGLMWAVVWLIAASAWYIDKAKCSVISTDSDLNTAYTRKKKKCWAVIFRGMLWSTLLLMFYMEISMVKEFFTGMLIVCGIYTALLLGMVLWAAGRFRKISSRYMEQVETEGSSIRNDDDRHWIWGMFYCNPNDSHWMVEERAGIGITLNLGKKGARILMILLSLCLLLLPASCVWIFMEEYVPIHLSVEADALVARQWKTDYEIPLNRLENVELVEYPTVQSRINGSAIDTLRKGVFRVKEYGTCELFLKQGQPLYLLLTQEDGTVYLLSGERYEETKKIYKELKSRL